MKDFASMTDAELMAAYKTAKSPAAAVSPLDAALSAEGVSGPLADLARSIYTQESGAGKNTKTSNAGAVGGMQIKPGTFSGVADKDWDINDPTQNARAGIRYLKQGYEAAGGDPALAGAFYYGGPGGLEKARRGVAVSDPRNPNAPNTLQYGAQVAARLPKEKGVIQRGVEAVIPSANAAEPVPANPLENMSDDELLAAYQKMKGGAQTAPESQKGTSQREPTGVEKVIQRIAAVTSPAGGLVDAATGGKMSVGAARGFKDIVDTGAELLAKGYDKVAGNSPNLSSLVTGQPTGEYAKVKAENDAGKADFTRTYGDSLPAKAGQFAGQVVGTYPIGGVIAAPLKAVAPSIAAASPAIGQGLGKLATAIESGGMSVGGAPAKTLVQGAGNMLARVAGGAITGGASAGAIDPSTAGTGALIGGALPLATKTAGMIGNGIGRAISGKPMAPEVKALADRAGQLGIDIPADRLANSKPLNALASSLEYVPFSGRTATMEKMQDQLNTALSKTFGQNSDNVTAALRKAQGDLGGKFDQVLKSNTVRVDQQFMTDLADAANMASRELGSDGAGIIGKQVDDILAKATTGEIDGQAAYNIKKTLDRISNRSTPEAFYARELKKKLMDALNRSLGEEQAAAFATVRKQYGNMLSLENLAQNGAEGNISIARLANMKNINNPELQELADISAQFLKPREGAHGAAQRAVLGTGALLTGGATGTLPAVGAGVALGRGTNSLLNSNIMKNAITGNPQSNQLLQFARSPEVENLLYRSAPVIGAGRQ